MKEHDEAMKTYEQGLSYDKDNSELREGLMRCQQAINKVRLSSSRRSTQCWLPWPPIHFLDKAAVLRHTFCLIITHYVLVWRHACACSGG